MGMQGAGNTEGPGAERREAPPASGLPCLNGDNSNALRMRLASGRDAIALTGTDRKVMFCLVNEIADLGDNYPVDRMGFMTLTFKENLTNRSEAMKRFNSLATGLLRK